jgi:phospholipase/lecithinase/hemolysin
LVPRLNGSPTTSIPATEESVLFNQILTAGLAIVHDFNRGRHLQLVQLDVFALFNQIVASPTKYSLADVTSSSQGIPTIDPDTYLFWDDLHPTTHGHNILALTAARVIGPPECLAKLEADCEFVQAGGGGGR